MYVYIPDAGRNRDPDPLSLVPERKRPPGFLIDQGASAPE